MLLAKIMQHLLEAARVSLERGDQRRFISIEFREKSFERDRRIYRWQPVLSALFRRFHHDLAPFLDSLSLLAFGQLNDRSLRKKWNNPVHAKFRRFLNDEFHVLPFRDCLSEGNRASERFGLRDMNHRESSLGRTEILDLSDRLGTFPVE
jgi:hypothetical protein